MVAHVFDPRTWEAQAGVNRLGLQSEFQESQAIQEKPYLERGEREKDRKRNVMQQSLVTYALNPTTPQAVRDQADLYKQVTSRAIYWGSV